MRVWWRGQTLSVQVVTCDVLVIGCGLAGLHAALNVPEKLSVRIIAKTDPDQSNSNRAQGGIAAALASEDSPQLHFADSARAGSGHCDEKALRCLVEEGPRQVRRLQDWGVPFDTDRKGRLRLAREAAHSKDRIARCHGDATGFHVTQTLWNMVRDRQSIDVHPHQALVDFGRNAKGSIAGALVMATQTPGCFRLFRARQTILASGGFGGLFSCSTNEPSLTGDGLAAALRLGIRTKDLEFIQFHPTALYRPGESPSFLISEAVRGEGAVLRDHQGRRFMTDLHELAELAPRDQVARAIAKTMREQKKPHVFLDATLFEPGFFPQRFPTIYQECQRRGLDPEKDWLPVAPAQHYCMGGVVTDLDAQTSAAGLLACGEVAMTGVYGANRLASNSLLECLVFGARAAETACKRLGSQKRLAQDEGDVVFPQVAASEALMGMTPGLEETLKARMSLCLGPLRRREDLECLQRWIRSQKTVKKNGPAAMSQLEAENLLTVASAVIEAALARRQSLGAHHWDEKEDIHERSTPCL